MAGVTHSQKRRGCSSLDSTCEPGSNRGHKRFLGLIFSKNTIFELWRDFLGPLSVKALAIERRGVEEKHWWQGLARLYLRAFIRLCLPRPPCTTRHIPQPYLTHPSHSPRAKRKSCLFACAVLYQLNIIFFAPKMWCTLEKKTVPPPPGLFRS